MADFAYDSYGNVLQTQEYGFQVNGTWQVRRNSSYVTTAAYVNAYLRNLVSETDTYDMSQGGSGTLIAKTAYAYDNYAAMGNMENYGGNYSGGTAPPGYNTAFNNQNLTVRGNLTGRTDYSDVVNSVSQTYDNKRDIFGNVVQEQVSCCNLNNYTFTANTYWTTPDPVIKGDPNGVHLTKLLTHDFNTQETTGTTDQNNLQTTFAYDNSGRSTNTTNPAGAQLNTTYNDATATTSSSASYTSNGSPISATGSASYDGWSRATQSVDSNQGQVNMTYDALGRLTSRTNPFPAGGTPGPATTFAYDPLGRLTVLTHPDSNTLQATYSGSTTIATDEVGRKTQKQTGGLGRLVSVTTQDSGGNLTLVTSYSYDMLDNVIQINQGGQVRSFKYDALSRETYESIPEQSATINDGTGTMWSMKFNYTSSNALLKITDPRGVEKHFMYDSLNRVTKVWYTGLGGDDAGTVLPALPSGVTSTNTVAFTYSTGGTTIGTLQSVSMTGTLPTYQESYSYDGVNHVASRTWSRDGQTYTVSYQRNQGGQITQVTYPSTRVVTANCDGSGRLSSLTDPNLGSPVPYVSNISYNAAGQFTNDTLGYVTAVNEAFSYESQRMQLTRQTATKSGGPTGGLLNLNYSYQAAAGQMGAGTTAGNAAQLMAINNSTINGATESAAYTYGLDKRLVSSSQTTNGISAQRRFAYDRWGNRTGQWDATTGGNEIQAITLQQSGGVPTNAIATTSNAGESVYNVPGQCGTPTTVTVGRTGRYVRVQLMGTNYLHLAEVQVIGSSGQNLAVGKASTQSSTGWGGTANRANDGNTDGNFADGSVSHTNLENQPWWQVDLGSSQQISSVNVWNRTDCCSSRTTNFNVIVSDQPVTTRGFIYDAAGNVSWDGAHSYQYDGENRLTSVDNGATASYDYDFRNHRFRRAASGAVTHYIWDGGKVLAEHNGSTGAQIVDYVYAGGSLVGEGSGNTLGGQGSFTFLVSDRLSIRLSLDKYGNVLGQQGHLPFGGEIGESGQLEKHHFTNYESDAETTTDYAINRQYAQGLGKFYRPDPTPTDLSQNRYEYSGSDPVNSFDPDGLFWIEAGAGEDTDFFGEGDPNAPMKRTSLGITYNDHGFDVIRPNQTLKAQHRAYKKSLKLPSGLYYLYTQALGIINSTKGITGDQIDSDYRTELGLFTSCSTEFPGDPHAAQIAQQAAALDSSGFASKLTVYVEPGPFDLVFDFDGGNEQPVRGVDVNITTIYAALFAWDPNDPYVPDARSFDDILQWEIGNAIGQGIGIEVEDAYHNRPGKHWPCDAPPGT